MFIFLKLSSRFIKLLNQSILMNQNSVKIIGINDEARKDSHLVYVNQADGLKGILNRDFDEWSNFDSWETVSYTHLTLPTICSV